MIYNCLPGVIFLEGCKCLLGLKKRGLRLIGREDP